MLIDNPSSERHICQCGAQLKLVAETKLEEDNTVIYLPLLAHKEKAMHSGVECIAPQQRKKGVVHYHSVRRYFIKKDDSGRFILLLDPDCFLF